MLWRPLNDCPAGPVLNSALFIAMCFELLTCETGNNLNVCYRGYHLVVSLQRFLKTFDSPTVIDVMINRRSDGYRTIGVHLI